MSPPDERTEPRGMDWEGVIGAAVALAFALPALLWAAHEGRLASAGGVIAIACVLVAIALLVEPARSLVHRRRR